MRRALVDNPSGQLSRSGSARLGSHDRSSHRTRCGKRQRGASTSWQSRLGGPQVDKEFDPRRLLDREISGLGTFEHSLYPPRSQSEATHRRIISEDRQGRIGSFQDLGCDRPQKTLGAHWRVLRPLVATPSTPGTKRVPRTPLGHGEPFLGRLGTGQPHGYASLISLAAAAWPPLSTAVCLRFSLQQLLLSRPTPPSGSQPSPHTPVVSPARRHGCDPMLQVQTRDNLCGKLLLTRG